MNFYQFNSASTSGILPNGNITPNGLMGQQLQQPQQPCDLMPPPPMRPGQTPSFLDEDNSNFSAPPMPKGSLPARIVSRNSERQSSLESANLKNLSWPSPDDGIMTADFAGPKDDPIIPSPKAADMLLEPNQIFDADGFHSHNHNSVSRGSSPVTISAADCDKAAQEEEDRRTLLHRACVKYPRKKSVIKAVLQKDPSAVLRRAFVPSCCHKSKAGHGHGSSNNSNKKDCNKYQLPINIALSHNASLEVLDALVKTDVSQLAEKDGIHGVNALCLALEKRPNDVAVLGMFLVSNPQLVRQRCDNHENTPLHVACQRGSSLAIVRQLFKLHPASLLQTNECGKTPVDILQQQAPYCKNAKASLEYLQQKLAALSQSQGSNGQ